MNIDLHKSERRTGTLIISHGLKRNNFSVIKLVEEYQDHFLKLGSLPKVIVHKGTAGRPCEEYLLNDKQVQFFLSLMRTTKGIVDLKCEVAKAGEVSTVMKMLESFDFGELRDLSVYGVSDEFGNVKIGISSDPQRRLTELQAANPGKLKLVFTQKATLPGYQSETELHNTFSDNKIHGEWFGNIQEQLKFDTPQLEVKP